MPLAEGYNPSGYDLQVAKLTPYGGGEPLNIAESISKIEISQNLDTISYSGYVEVLDNVGMLENLPIRGEETLDLEIQTLDLKTKIKQKLFVYSVSDITIATDGQGVLYKLNFISQLSFKAGTRKIIEAFQSKPADIVKKLFQDNFSKVKSEAEELSFETKRFPIVEDRERNLFIQPGTTGKLECIIPDYLPGKAMTFVAQRTFNSNTPSQFFRFFETLEGYYFCTDEFLMAEGAEEPFVLFYTPATGSLDPRNPKDQLNRVEAISIINRGSNTGSSLYNGAYASQVKEVDLLRRKVTDKNFFYTKDANYVDNTGEKAKVSNAPHSKEFIDETFKIDVAKQVIVFKDYAGENDNEGQLRGEQFFPQIISNRLSYLNHSNAIVLGCQLKGRADLMPGKVIDLSIQNADVSEEVKQNAQLSGRYLIRKTTHTFDKGVLSTSMTVAKYDWSK